MQQNPLQRPCAKKMLEDLARRHTTTGGVLKVGLGELTMQRWLLMQQHPLAYTSHGRQGADASFERGNPGPLANLPFPVFPQRCDAPPELPRATAESTSADVSFQRGNVGPEGKSHLRDSSKQWDLVKLSRSQKLVKRKREEFLRRRRCLQNRWK